MQGSWRSWAFFGDSINRFEQECKAVGARSDFFFNIKQEANMKIHALLMVMLVALAGCSTTYKGTIKGAYNPQETKNGISLVQNTAGTNSPGVSINR